MSTTPTPQPEVKPPLTFADFERQRGTIPTGTLAPESEEPPVVVNAPAGDDAKTKAAPEPKAAEPSGGPKSKPEDAEDKPPKGGFQRRIDSLTRDKYQLQGRITELERQLVGKPTTIAAGDGKAPTAATEGATPKPKLENFTTWEDYNEALTDWKADQKIAAALTKFKADQQHDAIDAQFQRRVDAAAAKYDDFMEVAALVPANNAVAQFMLRREHGPDVVYHLGKNPEDLARILALAEPLDIVAELLKIEAVLASASPEPKPAVSRAPKPPIQVTPTSVPTTKTPREAGSFKEFEELRRAKR